MTKQILSAMALAATLLSLSACMGNSIEISSVGDTMAYDKTLLEAKAGETVKLTLRNSAKSPAMLHNWVLIQPGSTDRVVMAALQAGQGKGYLPDGSPDVIAHTRLTNPGESDTIEFKAPATPGDYPFICTYPGHFSLMKGILRVK
ncbi:MAG TPA: plastocyanin/azurin family copper-binding protein [Bdellovibrionota bacterium]|nr:plastocyanin/azurin family copper-binding protein [Bdellovibrionota bacterium]